MKIFLHVLLLPTLQQMFPITLILTAGGNETYGMFNGDLHFTLGTGTIDSTITTSYSLSTLNPSSAYDFYVQAICSVNDSSYWTGPLTVSTLIQGPIGVNCISGNAGVVYTDDLESSNGWSGTFGTGSCWGLECKNWSNRINRNWSLWST